MMAIMDTPPSRKQITHDRIVGVASRAIRRGGYQGVGVADIMKEAGLTHGGFYAHFASRDVLVVEALEQAGRENREMLLDRAKQGVASGRSPFAAMLEAYLHPVQLDISGRGCVVASLAADTPRQNELVQAAARERSLALVALVREVVPAGVPAQAAGPITATMVGAVALARGMGGDEALQILEQTRQSLLDHYEPGQRTARATR